MAQEAEIVFPSLPTPDIIKAVVLGKGGLVEGRGDTGKLRVIVDLSTTGPSAVKALTQVLTPLGIPWVEAPVSGGIKGATEGTLAVMTSGPDAAKDEVLPLLRNFGRIFDVGTDAGQAQVAKPANNLMAAAAIAITSEGMAMATKAGIDPKVMLDIINVSSGRNSASQDKFPKSVLDGSFNFGFATGLSYKDVRMCVDESEAMGVPMVGGAVVRQMLAVLLARCGANSDSPAWKAAGRMGRRGNPVARKGLRPARSDRAGVTSLRGRVPAARFLHKMPRTGLPSQNSCDGRPAARRIRPADGRYAASRTGAG